MATDLSIIRSVTWLGNYRITSGIAAKEHRLDDSLGVLYSYAASGDNAASILFAKTYTTTASQSLSLDSGAIEDPFGNTLTFGVVRELYIANTGTANDLTVSGLLLDSIYGQASISTLVKPGECYLRGRPTGTGFTVTNGVSDTLVMNPGGVSVTWKVIILGTT